MKRLPLLVCSVVLTAFFASPAGAQEGASTRLNAEVARHPLDGMIRSAIGVTRTGTPIPCFITSDDLDPNTRKIRVLCIGGLDGKIESVRRTLEGVSRFLKESPGHDKFAISCVPCARPDILGQPEVTELTFPPPGGAYNQPDSDVAHYLWRWIGMHAPDLVVVVSENTETAQSLVGALAETAPCETGMIPAMIHTPTPAVGAWIATALKQYRDLGVSPARLELQRRVARTPIEVAGELGKVYGHQVDPISYIPSLAVIGRIRLGELTGDSVALQEAESMTAPFRKGGKDSMGEKPNGSTLSGHLIFSELARRTGDEDWKALARKAADYGFDEKGQPKESMPFHSEMSDSVFMGCAPLAEAAALTGEKKYAEMCLRHLRFMQGHCLREDGLYRHSPLDESAWGRGNGFPALGMALSLSALPEESAEHAAFLESYRDHLAALKKHQDPTGAWHQVIDREESYREFTATSMIAFAIVRGLRRGWLDEAEWSPVVEKSWQAIKSRIGPEGKLVDVCTGTGKMNRLRDYYDRTAILGKDDRGGAMALLVATEMAFWEREKLKR